MKKLLAVIVTVFACQFAFAQETITLKINIDGVIKNKGDLRISVFNSSGSWLKEPVKAMVVDLTKESGDVVEIAGLEKGTYALVIIQDENKNGELDMGAMGPTEGLGYSNGARGMFGPASYDKAKMDFESDSEITIALK